MKKTLSLLLSLLLLINVVSCATVTVSAASASDLKFTLNSDGKSYSVEARNKTLTGSLVIPGTFSGYPVTIINDNAFEKCNNLVSVTIPDSVKVIGDSAFYHCNSLTSVLMEDSVISIGECAFSDSRKLASLKISNSITNIEAGTFMCCENLTSFKIPEGVESIGRRAFEYCIGLTSITIPDGVTSIGEDAFYLCRSLSSVYITDISNWCKIKFDGDNANPLCCAENLYLNGKLATDIVIPEGITEIPTRTFYNYGKLRTIDIPDSVKIIGEEAFAYCDRLTSVTIPQNVEKICYRAFVGCKKLTFILLHNNITEIEAKAFLDCYNLKGTYYTGTAEEWNYIYIDDVNGNIYNNVILNHDARKPLPPILTSISNTASGTKITWDKVIGADEYKVYRKTYNAKTKAWSGWTRLAIGVTSTSYVDKTAKSGTYYRYTVIASNEAGNSSYDATGLKTYFLATPTVSATNSNSGVVVKWTKAAGATGYYVYRKTGNGNWQKIATVKGASKVSYTDTKAKSGVTYRYTVKAYYSSYVSAYNTNGFAVRRLTTPTLKSVTSAKSGVTFKWNKVTGATGYIVYRKTGNGSWVKLATVTGNSAVSYLDKTAKKGVTYTYTVRAYYGTSTSYYNTKGLSIKDKY